MMQNVDIGQKLSVKTVKSSPPLKPLSSSVVSSVSAEIFCLQIDPALFSIPGTFPCADDVKVQGTTEECHNIHLLETVEKARKAGLKFNPNN